MTEPARPRFGVVVLTMGNRPDDLNRGLASLLSQRDVDLDVVVVGNGWQPVNLPEGVKAKGLRSNRGIPAGRNAGAPLVDGKLLFFLDDDACLPADDILARMAKRSLAKVAISVTTLDPKLSRVMEPRAPTPPRRLEALRQRAQAGVPTSVMVAPVIPAINDAEIERILDAAAALGVQGAGYVLLRLPLEVRDLFREWLMANFPDRYRHVFKLIRDTRGGRDYDSEFGKRMTGSGPIAWMIGRRFEAACDKLNLNKARTKLTTDHFCPPRRAAAQLSFF